MTVRIGTTGERQESDEAGQVADARKTALTTRELIERLQAADPSGERFVFLEITLREHTETDKARGIFTEDGGALWDEERLRVILTNEATP